jgi:GNAT superfamily N-acetyltransferase
VSDHSTPDDLEDRLLAAGLCIVPDDYETEGPLLTDEPPPGPPGVDARRLVSLEEYAEAQDVAAEAFAFPPEQRRPRLEHAADWAVWQASEHAAVYGAWLDGELVATGRAFFSPRGALLSGGATLPRARGRGAYRALVRARWEDAAARGTAALAVQAKKETSAPILRRLGFEQVVQFRRLQDVLSVR